MSAKSFQCEIIGRKSHMTTEKEKHDRRKFLEKREKILSSFVNEMRKFSRLCKFFCEGGWRAIHIQFSAEKSPQRSGVSRRTSAKASD